MTELLDVVDNALAQYSSETERLRFLPENRYNVALFPTIGQYDWFSGQLLYCLVRYLQPVRVIEISTSSGYSSLFSALALKANGFGRLETFELVPSVAAAAQTNFERFGVANAVRLYVGDARQTVGKLAAERRGGAGQEILFLDGEHTEEFARFYLDTFLPDAHPESLFQMHDILPPTVKLMYRPLEAMSTPAFRWHALFYRVLRRISSRLVPPDLRCWVRPVPFDPMASSEACLGHYLSAHMPAESQVYVHDVVSRYPTLKRRVYDHTSVWRCDRHGKPMEWNESWWAECGALGDAYFSRQT